MPIFRVNDAELHYRVAGRGEPVLLLHGLGSAADDWLPQIEALRPSHRVIALDARGSGESRDLRHPHGPFTVKQFAQDAATLLDALGAVPAHVVGLSMGGMIAFQLAVDAPGHVRTLTIVNSAPALVPHTLAEHAAVLVRQVVSKLLGPKQMAKLLAPKLFPRPEQEELRRAFLKRMAANDKDSYAATLDAIVGWSVLDRINAITAPTLIIASDQDYTPVSAKEAYAKRMPNAQVVVVKDAHHAVPVEAPEKFNPLLAAHLARFAAAPARVGLPSTG